MVSVCFFGNIALFTYVRVRNRRCYTMTTATQDFHARHFFRQKLTMNRVMLIPQKCGRIARATRTRAKPTAIATRAQTSQLHSSCKNDAGTRRFAAPPYLVTERHSDAPDTLPLPTQTQKPLLPLETQVFEPLALTCLRSRLH